MRTGNILSILGALVMAAGILAGDQAPWFLLKWSEIAVTGLEFNLGLVLLGFAGLVVVFAGASLFFRKRVLAMSNTMSGVLALLGLMVYFFDVAQILALPKGESAIVGLGYYLVAAGAGAVILGTLVVFASNPAWRTDSRFLRVALLWNGTIIQERVLTEPSNVTVGEDLRNMFILPAEHLPKKMMLFKGDRKGNYKVGLRSDLDGKVTIRGTTETIADYVKKHTGAASGTNYVDVELGDWGIVNFGQLSLFFQFIQPEERIVGGAWLAFDKNIFATTFLSAVVQISFILATLYVWKEEAVRKKRPDIKKYMKIEVAVTEKEEEKEEELELGEEEDTTGKKAEGEEGKFGDPDIDPKIESKVPKKDGKMVDKIDPKKVGLNDLLSTNKLGGKGAIANILSSNTSGFSNKLAIAMSGTGSEFVMGHGSGGMGFKGTGSGGGGTGGYGRIHGLGKIDTGGGAGVSANLGKKAAKKVGNIKLGSGSSQGFCQKSNIQSVVRRRAGAIRACYERELQLHPKLGGKITVRWTINLEGKVQGATTVDSSMGNKNVEGCVLRAIRRMRFSKPEGGVCVVQWPFVFNAGG